MAGRLLAVLLVAGTLAPPALAQTGVCPGGRFYIQADRVDAAIVIDSATVAIEGICPPVSAEIAASPRGTTVRAAWAACRRPWRGRMRLRALVAPGCERMTGIIRRRRPATARRFVAVRIAMCGNGILEAPETCDDGNAIEGDCCMACIHVPPGCPGYCLTNADCAADAFCRKGIDCCDGPGVCRTRPAACTDRRAAVCGCDWRSYASACEAAVAGVSVHANDGGCTCGTISGIECPSAQFCDLQAHACGGADLAGTCAPVPTSCPLVADRVCGCDGVTYLNDCRRLAKRAQKAHTGPCR